MSVVKKTKKIITRRPPHSSAGEDKGVVHYMSTINGAPISGAQCWCWWGGVDGGGWERGSPSPGPGLSPGHSPRPPELLVLAQPCSHNVICQVCPYNPLPWGWVNSSTRGYFFKKHNKNKFSLCFYLFYIRIR